MLGLSAGLTSIKRLAPVELAQLPEGLAHYERHAKAIGEKVRMNELPPGFSVYKGQAFEIKTAMVQSQASVTVRLPSVKSEAEFGKLVLLYLDEDSMVPGALQWETYPEHLGQQRSDFKTRTITAGFDYFTIFHHSTGAGRLVVASFNQEEYDKSSVDLYFTSIVGPPYVKLGEIFSYSISIKNWGGTGLAAEDVVVNSTINSGRFVSATSSQGGCRQSVNSTPNIICELGRVDFGKTVTMTVNIRSDEMGMMPEEREITFSTINTVRARNKDYSPENNYYQSLGTIIRR